MEYNLNVFNEPVTRATPVKRRVCEGASIPAVGFHFVNICENSPLIKYTYSAPNNKATLNMAVEPGEEYTDCYRPIRTDDDAE